MRRCRGGCRCLLVVLLAGGCQPKPTPIEPVPPVEPAVDVPATRWPFWPAHMRVHPLTRVTTDPATGRPIIEARVEFTDRFGDTTKCLGKMRLQLNEPDSDDNDYFAMWNIDLGNLQKNATHFDTVTRTYLFRLTLEEPVGGGEAEIRAFFVPDHGEKLRARMAMDVR